VSGARALLALVCASTALLPACRREPSQRVGAVPAAEPHAERQKVRAFWQTFGRATDARMRRDCATAAGLYQEALELDPRHEDALYYLGQCLRELGRPAQSRAAFERLVALNDASARGHLALGALLASPDADEPVDLAAAERHLRRAHAINGEETGPIVRLGEVLLVTGRAGEAGAAFEAALRTNPKSVEAAFLAGFVAWDAGQVARADRLARRLREASKVEAPVKGVLSEGDRREATRIAAPLESPLGRLLFGELVAEVRRRGAAGLPLTDAFVRGLWQAARRQRDALQRRGRSARVESPGGVRIGGRAVRRPERQASAARHRADARAGRQADRPGRASDC
jgi:tetratricopeptide (TPR) repeat protein